jgi:hypothetical protein
MTSKDTLIDNYAKASVALALQEARLILRESEHKNTSGTREVIMLAQILLEEKHRIKDETNGTD